MIVTQGWTRQPQGPVRVNPRIAPAFAICAGASVSGLPTAENYAIVPPIVARPSARMFNIESGYASHSPRRARDLNGANGLTGLAIISPSTAQLEWGAGDGGRDFVNTRNVDNQGWSWGRSGASAGGSLGDLTRQKFTLNGVADYFQGSYTIPSFAETVIAVRFTGSTVEFFDDGGVRAPVSRGSTGTGSLVATTSMLVFGTVQELGGQPWLGQVGLVALWPTALPVNQILELVRNPWQIFAGRSAPIGVASISMPPTAPTGVTAGSITALSATCSWTDTSGDETGFKVQYAPSPYSSWTTVTGSPTAANATSLATGNVLTDGVSYRFRVASTNANGDSAWVESGVFNTPALTRLRPNADTTVGAWTPSTGSTLFGVIDEAVADDADYITTASATTGKVKVEVSTDPADDTNHSVSIRARATSGTLTVSLVQGHPSETLIKAWTPSLTSSFATYVLTMSSGEAAGITDYSDLYLKFVTT